MAEKTLKLARDGSAALPATAEVSVPGRRSYNEDVAVRLHERVGGVPVSLVAVADGMGGHERGEVAAALAADALRAGWEPFVRGLSATVADGHAADAVARGFLRAAFHDAEARIAAASNGASMGTTLTAALALGSRALTANVGDSRCYMARADGIAQLTEDHSVVAEAVREGALTPAEAASSPYQNALTRSLDGSGDAEPDLNPPAGGWIELGDGAILLACSDGLCGALPDDRLEALLRKTPTLQDGLEAAVAAAYERGSSDNITLVGLEHGAVPRSPAAASHDPAAVGAMLHQARGGTPPLDVTAAPETAPRPGQPAGLGRTPWVLAAVAGALLVAVAMFLWRGDAEPPAFETATTRTTIAWRLLADGASPAGYRVFVSTAEQELLATVDTPDTLLTLAAVAEATEARRLPPGEYVWRVEALRPSGRPGAPALSRPQPLAVPSEIRPAATPPVPQPPPQP